MRQSRLTKVNLIVDYAGEDDFAACLHDDIGGRIVGSIHGNNFTPLEQDIGFGASRW